MSENKKEEKNILKNIKERMSKLTVISNTMMTEAKERAKIDLSALEKKWDKVDNHLEKLGDKTEGVWSDITESFEEAWEDLSQHFGKAISRFKKEGIAFRDQWEFYEDSSNKWRWRRSDLDKKTVGSSHTGFKTRDECVENAQRHGYEDK